MFDNDPEREVRPGRPAPARSSSRFSIASPMVRGYMRRLQVPGSFARFRAQPAGVGVARIRIRRRGRDRSHLELSGPGGAGGGWPVLSGISCSTGKLSTGGFTGTGPVLSMPG